jgi:hypothetical protein
VRMLDPAEAEGVPVGGGVEFVLNGNSTFDLDQPYAASLTGRAGENRLEAYIVDSAMNRLPNPEAQLIREQLGIGVLYTTLGDAATAGRYGTTTTSLITSCADAGPTHSQDCRNFFQRANNQDRDLFHPGYQMAANDHLTRETGQATFLISEGYGGYMSGQILNKREGGVRAIDFATSRIQSLGTSRVFLMVGKNDAHEDSRFAGHTFRAVEFNHDGKTPH